MIKKFQAYIIVFKSVYHQNSQINRNKQRNVVIYRNKKIHCLAQNRLYLSHKSRIIFNKYNSFLLKMRKASPAKQVKLMTDTTHLYVKLQHPGSRTEHTIKKIIGQRHTSFRKAIIYAASVPRARNIQNSLNKQAIVIVSQHDLKKRGERYLNFILQGKVLVTNLRPNELFTLQQPKGVLNIDLVDLIINEKIPETKEQYFEKSNKLKSKDANKLTIISIADQSQVAKLSQSCGILITDIYQKKQPQPAFRPPIAPPKNTISGKSLSFQSPKANQQQNPETKKNSKATNFFSKRQNSSGKKSQKQQSRSTSRNNRLKTVSFNDQTLPVRRTDQNKKKWIRSMVVGLNTKFTSCLRLELYAVYVDHTATNRPFKTIEEMVDHAKLYAANPHTEHSHFGQYSTGLMAYAKDSLLASFNSPKDQYTVLPTGAGSTGAIEKAVSFLKIWEQNPQYQWKNPIIFVTPYEHHSNILPWVQFYPQGSIKQLAHDDKFTLNFKQVKRQINNCGAKCIIVSVSAASNVTSKLTRLKELNDLIKNMRTTKQKNIVFCVDCAAFCCHQQLDLQKYDQIDFAFLSPHKNLGGAESCGVLVARNNIINSSKPTFPGGGTVKFVKGYSREDVMYETGNFAREIAGTPPFFGFYRAALSFQLLTNKIGYEFIHDQQTKNTIYFFKRIEEQNKKLSECKCECQIVIYGDTNLNERANVVTFNIVLQNEKTLQQNLVSRILNDVFGIQVRSGCFCAGPHGIKLLQLTQSNIVAIQQEVEAGLMTNKPGYVRLDLAFYLEQFEIQYIVAAISMIAMYWKNYERIYDLKKNGEIEVSAMNVPKKKMIYSLSDHEQAKQIWKWQNDSIEEGLRQRKQILQNQLQQAQKISINPVTFLKTVSRN